MVQPDIRIEAWFDCTREIVFNAWTSPEVIATWFAAPPWTVADLRMTAREGETWWVEFLHPDGRRYREEGRFEAVSVPDRLVFSLQQVGLQDASPVTSIAVTFHEAEGGTRVQFVQSGFQEIEHRHGNAAGWEGCFRLLRETLALG
jgi:uncharacterized protein YndB with AHSA1/START domain